MAHIALLWHLHQPDYADPRTGRPVMRWTRMHALRGYRDLAVECAELGVACTINLVPSLLDQLLWYADGGDDDHLELTRRPVDGLQEHEALRIRHSFIAGHPVMVEAHPAYVALRDRVRSADPLANSDLRDLQVWSTLAWFGATARRDHPEIDELIAKGAAFTASDKAVMLAVQDQVVRALPHQLAALAHGPTRLSTTPYYHPILPLLVNTEHARRCMPDVPLDAHFSWPQDARLHLERARERFAEVLGADTRGLWPSEGSVSPEVATLAAQTGFRWLASDEHVLHRSEHDPGPNNGGWDLGDGIVGFFRDRDLSDRIGFRYAKRDGAQAAAELLHDVAARGGDGVVTVALDGENPWESYADAGRAFRQALHAAMERGPVRGISLDEAAERPAVGRVHRLHTGSWINADFGIWFGHADDRTAWRLVAQARQAIDDEPDAERARAALDKLLPAQGSDWTWWYGDEFSTEFAPVFDALFREHLRAAWLALGRIPPAEIDEPIGGTARPQLVPPKQLIGPGDRWVDWAGAGVVRWEPRGSMATGVRHALGLRYGFDDAGDLHVRVIQPDAPPTTPEGARWELRIAETTLSAPPGPVVAFRVPSSDAEIAVSLRLVAGEREIARHPDSGAIRLARPQPLAREDGWV